MNRLTIVFLVLLRLAIGWHFLFEGLEKVTSYEKTTKPTWSSEAYLRESAAPGLLGSAFRSLAGDGVLDRYQVAPLPEGADPIQSSEAKQLPPALAKDWRGFFDRFVEYYQLTPEQRQHAEAVLAQHEAQTALWLRGKGDDSTSVTKHSPPAGNADVEVKQTAPDRVKEYRAQLKLVEGLEAKTAEFGIGAKKELDKAKAKARTQRRQLQSDLVARTTAMADGLFNILDEKQQEMRPELEPLEASRSRLAGMSEDDRADQPAEQLRQPVGRRILDYGPLDWADFLTRWGLVVMGGCLLLGFCTRPACVAGALFLLLLYLAMPPWLGVPEVARSEGRFIVNKNLVEMLALLTLATTASGRWLGLDGLLQFLNPRRWRRAPRAPRRVRMTGPTVSATTTPS